MTDHTPAPFGDRSSFQLILTQDDRLRAVYRGFPMESIQMGVGWLVAAGLYSAYR